MDTTSLFDDNYRKQKHALLPQVVDKLQSIYTDEELQALRIDPISSGILSQRSGRGFVNRDLLETVLGNLLECVAPGSHNVSEAAQATLIANIEDIADQLYAMIYQSLQITQPSGEPIEDIALQSTFALISRLPELKTRARWNRFASLKDPAVWDAYLRKAHDLTEEELSQLDFAPVIDEAIANRDFGYYERFLQEEGLQAAFDYQMQLVSSAYPGWRVLFYHDIAHALTRSGQVDEFICEPVPLLPRAISELGGRYYQADLHPETTIADANFLEHPHRGLTTGQTGIIGHGCVLYPCTLGGLTEKARQRHPVLGNFVKIGTDATLLGPVAVGDRSTIGSGSDIYGFVQTGTDCQIASSVVLGTVRSRQRNPGRIILGDHVRIGDGTIVENSTELDLVIPDKSDIPARSHIVNDGFGNPKYARE